MKRNEVTEIRDLQNGDRFYKVGDKHKTVFEKIEHETKMTKYQTYSHWGCVDGSNFPQAFKSDTQVVFLRNKIEANEQERIN